VYSAFVGYLRCGRLNGNGQFRANGGSAAKEGGDGGGRIAIWRTHDGFPMTITATAADGAGGSPAYQATDGSVVWRWLPSPGMVIW